jgi:hypothetical protein
MRMVLPVGFMVVISPEIIVGWFVSVGKQAPEISIPDASCNLAYFRDGAV